MPPAMIHFCMLYTLQGLACVLVQFLEKCKVLTTTLHRKSISEPYLPNSFPVHHRIGCCSANGFVMIPGVTEKVKHISYHRTPCKTIDRLREIRLSKKTGTFRVCFNSLCIRKQQLLRRLHIIIQKEYPGTPALLHPFIPGT